jgi:RNA polymerase-binding transcription factor
MLDATIYKTKLLSLRDEIADRIQVIEKDLHHEEHTIEKDFAEQATQLENEEVLNSLDNEARATAMEINKALLRIENNTFGRCTECNEQINEQRLVVSPYASMCVPCTEKDTK